jgi:hypothetical protein
LKLQYDEPLSNFGFKLNLRRYNLDVLQWAREHDCPWDSNTCLFAASRGHLEVLQWARAHGCPWHKQMCERESRLHIHTWAWVCAQA